MLLILRFALPICLLTIFTSCGDVNKSKSLEDGINANIVCADTLDFIQSNPSMEGYIPNETTAIKVAEAIWLPIYGKEIYEYKPFKAILGDNDVWIVSGTVHTQKGGSPFALIQKKDGKIIDVYHEE